MESGRPLEFGVLGRYAAPAVVVVKRQEVGIERVPILYHFMEGNNAVDMPTKILLLTAILFNVQVITFFFIKGNKDIILKNR